MKTRTQLAEEYGIDRKTFSKLLKNFDIQLPKGIILPELVEQIYLVLGPPRMLFGSKTRKIQNKISFFLIFVPQLSPKIPNIAIGWGIPLQHRLCTTFIHR